MDKQIDFLAVGDIVTDAFIELAEKEAWIETDNPHKEKELCMKFGDKLPYKDVKVVAAVGNSPNAAVSAHRLGLNSHIVTNLGNDDFGKEQLETLKKEGVGTDFVTVHDGLQSNYHYVLRYGPERTILVKHTEFPYIFPDISPSPKWIYLSSLASNSLPYHQALLIYLQKNPESKLAFQPGTFQMQLGKDKLKGLYERSDLFFCNREEAMRILETKNNNIEHLLEGMHNLGPKMIVITDGPDGAYVFDGQEIWWGPMYPDPKPPIDRTGAGDSFASTFTSALALGMPVSKALEWGPINSMSVVQYIGAQEGLLSREKLEEYLANAPEDYKAKQL